ncbi:hypothetical protein PP459_gp105 [Streptomyces phage Wakanda]|uniref:KTSC domain-containing protein n=2 Tax=Wakandavirus TaxID=3044854 RepID=A0A6G8R3E2_9CAUD|nr:hypothetical protein PP459_gp105 [Streptomyces phage Wakanda]YP_010652449.1 hypothetical protein PP460_gp109 [Streptomyces phage Muntaha]QIN94128.1 hypothetical protein SEA_WAKANDA_166 [Streptomyces phage Wakanda]QIN94693.1 hypothetical protein SEA_MUNTAHA_168 [Streptomyces phage Muntaha]
MFFEYTDKAELASSWIRAAYYNSENGELAVEMKNGQSYVYMGVEPDTIKAFGNAYSAGSFYNTKVQGKFPNVYGGAVTMKYGKMETMTAKNTRTYTVRAIVPFEAQIEASSLDEAVRLFVESHSDVKGVTIKEVVVPFGE